MKAAGVRPGTSAPAMARVLAIVVALVLALACLADVAHAAGGEADGCSQGKLEGSRSPALFVDAVLLPDRVEPGRPALLARVVQADRSVTFPPVSVWHSAPRAPPAA